MEEAVSQDGTSPVSGYQIQLATNAKFNKGVKNVTVSGYTAASGTITRLKAKTTYYVRIRTYNKVGALKFFSKWSAAKRVTAK